MVPASAVLRGVRAEDRENAVADVLFQVFAPLVVVANLFVPELLKIGVSAVQLLDSAVDMGL
jgi:hypothetical protein